jgi:hypothetical protein
MKNKIKFLIDETKCEQNEAELALSISKNNIEKSIEIIKLLSKFINIFKIKIILKKNNIYGLIQIVLNTKTRNILRFSMILSYNPSTYEISINTDWFSFEKSIFSLRLDSGAIEQYTQKIEENLKAYIQQIMNETIFISTEEISTIIKNFFYPINIHIEIKNNELTLLEYTKFPDYKKTQNQIYNENNNINFLQLKSKIIEDKNGKNIKKIKEGDKILSTIIDERDIAHYITHLIGGIDNNIISPIPATIKKIFHKNNKFILHIKYTTSITGFAEINNDVKIKIIKNNNSFIKKILSW